MLHLFMNTSRILCNFQYQKGHKKYTASSLRTRHTNCQTDSTTVMALCQKLSCKIEKNILSGKKIFHGWRMENMGPEISNFSHTIPNYCRHFVQIIARKSMTGRGGRLPWCLFQRYKKFSLLYNLQRKQYEIHRFLSLTTLSSSVCLF